MLYTAILFLDVKLLHTPTSVTSVHQYQKIALATNTRKYDTREVPENIKCFGTHNGIDNKKTEGVGNNIGE